MTDTPRPDRTLEEIAERLVQQVAELPGRTSPDDWPKAMLVTGAELREIALAALSSAQARTREAEQARTPQTSSACGDSGSHGLVRDPEHGGSEGVIPSGASSSSASRPHRQEEEQGWRRFDTDTGCGCSVMTVSDPPTHCAHGASYRLAEPPQPSPDPPGEGWQPEDRK